MAAHWFIVPRVASRFMSWMSPIGEPDCWAPAIEGANAPKSMGVIPINQRVDVPVKSDVLAGFGPGVTLAITLEPKGGSPTGGPTGPVVAAGKATPI